MEPRLLLSAALLEIEPVHPLMAFDNTGTVAYAEAGDQLSVRATPLSFQQGPGEDVSDSDPANYFVPEPYPVDNCKNDDDDDDDKKTCHTAPLPAGSSASYLAASGANTNKAPGTDGAIGLESIPGSTITLDTKLRYPIQEPIWNAHVHRIFAPDDAPRIRS
jgi:hypothetical protein